MSAALERSNGPCAASGGGVVNGLPYYKRYPRDLIEGTIGMPFELKVTYAFILDLIYLQGGRLPDDPRYIAGLLGVSVRKWNSLRQGLVDLNKIQVSGEFLTNYRAIIELESLAKVQDKQRENRSRLNKNNNLQSPRSNHTEPDTDIIPVGTVAEAPVDLGKVIFRDGLRLLIQGGMAEQKARSLLGKWRRDHGDPALIDALSRAQREGAIDPVSFITGCFRFSAKKSAPQIGERRQTRDGRNQEFQGGGVGWVTIYA